MEFDNGYDHCQITFIINFKITWCVHESSDELIFISQSFGFHDKKRGFMPKIAKWWDQK